MKFGPMEGSPEEIKNFFQDNGLRAADYLTVPEAPIKTVWFIVPGAIVVGALVVLTLFTPTTQAAVTFVFLVGCAAVLWLTVNAQIRFKNLWATGIIGVGCFLLLLVALGVVTPIGVLQEIKSWRK